MPTERFYRLPEAKRQLIREAAMKEFARVPFEKASINQIIHNADISRGSFYTYFEDKADVVEFIFEDGYNQMRERCQNELERCHGDYFRMLEFLFEDMVGKLKETNEMMELVRNVFSYQENTRALGFGERSGIAQECDLPAQWVFERIDRNLYRFETKEAFQPVVRMGMLSTLFCLKEFYEHPDQLEQVRAQHRQQLEVLKYGACRDRSGQRES